jgi:hypothetical protein
MLKPPECSPAPQGQHPNTVAVYHGMCQPKFVQNALLETQVVLSPKAGPLDTMP